MANRGGGRGPGEGRGRGDQVGGRASNNGRAAQQGFGRGENFSGPQGFNNFFVGGPSGTASGGGNQNQVGGFFNGGFQNGFQGVPAAFQVGPMFQGGATFPGPATFSASNGFQGGAMLGTGYPPYGFQVPQMGFSAGTGFDGVGRGGGAQYRRRITTGGRGGRAENYRGRGRGRQNGLGRGDGLQGDEQDDPSVENESLPVVNASQTVAAASQSIAQPMLAGQPMQNTQAAANAGVAPVDGVPAKKGKNLDKLKCNRCGLAGHIAAGCITPLCDYCERADHANIDCHLHKAPKPQLKVYGICDEELMFFEMPLTGTYKPKMENSRAARITVSGVVMTSPQIVSQLQRLVPTNDFVWEVVLTEDNSFKVLFPSKEELERLKVFGAFQVPNSVCKLTVDSWGARLEPLYMLPEVWVRISGLPSRPRGDYLALWSIGDLFGKTLEVDMPYTRQHGVVRIRLRCMDYTRIPANKHLLVKDGFYDLQFQVENVPIMMLISILMIMGMIIMVMAMKRTWEMARILHSMKLGVKIMVLQVLSRLLVVWGHKKEIKLGQPGVADGTRRVSDGTNKCVARYFDGTKRVTVFSSHGTRRVAVSNDTICVVVFVADGTRRVTVSIACSGWCDGIRRIAMHQCFIATVSHVMCFGWECWDGHANGADGISNDG
ncbi:hypothetical protein ACQ4PT_053345 [Festuca glaucescens]